MIRSTILFVCCLVTPTLLARKPIPVTVQPLEQISIYPVSDVPATVLSLQESTVSSEIKGRITELPVEVGDAVQLQQPLVSFDCVDYRLALDRAQSEKQALESELALSRWQLTRTKKLAQANNASEELVKQHEAKGNILEAKLITQQAIIAGAQEDVQRCTLVAPFPGVITNRMKNLGEYANPGTPILHLVNTDTLEVEALLHPMELTQLKKASNIHFKVGDISYDVALRSIVQSQDPKSRTQVARFTFQQEKPIPGTAGRVTWKSQQPAIPAEFLRQVGNTLGFFIVNQDKAKFLPIPNAIEGQPAILETSMKASVIINGRYAVEDGSPITIQSND